MDVKSQTRYCRITARKMRLVADLVRGHEVNAALSMLQFSDKKAADIIEKTLRSAIANAQNKEGMDVDRLKIKTAFVDEGPTWKRFLPRAMGRATKLLKRTSHVTLVLTDEGTQ